MSVTIGTLKQEHRSKMYPTREEFTELIYYISELKHQYSDKIDEQTIKINDQSGVIEELLWQIRELSDKMRQMSSKMIEMETTVKNFKREDRSCVCRYENHIPANRSIFSRQASMISRRNTAKGAKIGTTINANLDDDDSSVYETIEFSDSSSNVYTEPIRDYGALRKVNIITSPSGKKQKPPSGLKKSNGSRNLQKFKAMTDVSLAEDHESEPNVELRVKPYESTDVITCATGKLTNSLISDIGAESIPTTESSVSFTQPRDVSGILINFGCSNSRLKNDFQERVSY